MCYFVGSIHILSDCRSHKLGKVLQRLKESRKLQPSDVCQARVYVIKFLQGVSVVILLNSSDIC